MKIILLKDNEYAALQAMLEDYSNTLANNGCNDLSAEIEKLFTKKEGQKLAAEYAVYNNPDNPEGPNWPLMDVCLLGLLQHKMDKSLLTSELIEKAISNLNDVRTGEDFEVICHNTADALQSALDSTPFNPNE